jgi:RNA polymerase sporulation-specific sigma factor
VRGTDAPSLLEAARHGDNEACERLLLDNSGLIWSVAKRYFGRGVENEDLYQLGCLGFLKAVRGFDPDYGTQFSTYAVPKIAGEIRRFLRDDGVVKVSRSVKENALAIRASRERLIGQLGREPTLSELSQATGLDTADIAAAETATLSVASIQSESSEDGFSLETVLGVDGMEDDVVERLALRGAIDRLPLREREVIFLRFYKNLTQDRSARVLGVSQVQVSRLERRAVKHLREILSE